MTTKMQKSEIRQVTGLKVDEGRTVTGLAIPVESRSALLYDPNASQRRFYETISRSAVTEELISNNDIRLLYNHEKRNGTLGRSKFGEGSLRLFIEDDGLHFECELPETNLGDAMLSGIRRGEIDAVSFEFYKGEDDWTKNDDGTWNRTIRSFSRVTECSLLDVQPAYDDTSVALRELEEHIEQEAEEERKKQELLEKLETKKQDINKLCNELI